MSRKISIIVPVYNEALSIGQIIRDVHETLRGEDYEILVIDDASSDETAAIARAGGARVISHPYNIGNGASVKTGMRNASGDIFVLIDGDGQHDPRRIPDLLRHIDTYDMVVAARTKLTKAPLHRKLANTIYNSFASYLVDHKIADLTSGFRAIKAPIARKFIYLLPNTFSYPSTITMALFRSGHSVKYVPIEIKQRQGRSKINLVADGSRFLVIIMKIATLFSPLRIFLPVSLICLLFGIGHSFYKIWILHERYTSLAVLFITTGVMVFLMGLIAEQIVLLRIEQSEK